MRSYSLVENLAVTPPVPVPAGLMSHNQLVESKAMAFWNSSYSIDQIDEYCSLVCEGDLLLEFSLKDFVMDNLQNVLQAGIGAALEGGISIGSFGVGTPAGVAAESANDFVFFGMNVVDVISNIKGVFSGLAEIKDSVVEIFSQTIRSTPQEIYDAVLRAVTALVSTSKRLGLDLEKYIEKLREACNDLIRKMAKVAGDAIAVFVPIPGADAAVQNAIAEFADDAYKAFLKIYDKIPDFLLEIMHDPAKLTDTMMGVFSAAKDWLSSIITGETSLMGTIKSLAFGAAGAIIPILKKTGAGEKIINWISNNVPGYIETAVDALAKIYPIVMSGLSCFAVLQSGDYKEE